MSFEQLALLLMLVAIPLLDRLIRAMRARTNESMQAGAPTAAEPPVSAAPPPLPARDARGTAPAPVLVAVPLPPRPLPALRPRPVAPPAARRATAAERRPAVREPRAMDLRVAIRSMAILGPCRAIEPRDATQIW
jgi:hypothetical protein